MKNLYLERYAWPGPILTRNPKEGTKLIVVIPCYNEPDIIRSLRSLHDCDSAGCIVEVIVVINHGKGEAPEIKKINENTSQLIDEWTIKHQKKDLFIHTIKAFNLNEKQAGVGLARKIGMDEAVRRFEMLGDKKGIIICFDADCLCSANYLHSIHHTYIDRPLTNVGLVDFEHPLSGKLPMEVYDGIVEYEMHLRYYKNALKYAGLPFSFHTIGSCITVTSEAYQKQGGMNKRKAGEDFYFLQKLFPHGGIENINKATVYPSPRPSDRVPFGTGKAINDLLKNKDTNYLTYHPKTFQNLKSFVDLIPNFYQEEKAKAIIKTAPDSIQKFLLEINFEENLLKIKNNTPSKDQFIKSFYQWFNGFSILKYVHFTRDNYFSNIMIIDAINWLLTELGYEEVNNKKKGLRQLREIDKLD